MSVAYRKTVAYRNNSTYPDGTGGGGPATTRGVMTDASAQSASMTDAAKSSASMVPKTSSGATMTGVNS